MNRSEKKDFVAKLKNDFDNSTTIIVTHYSGLSVKETEQIRNAMRENGAKFKVTTNSLTKLALANTQFENIADIILWDSSGFELSLDWNFDWIKSIQSNVTKMIAGNINIDKLEKIFNLADIVDVSGALETNKVKDMSKIKNFLNNLKKLNDEN